VYGLCATGDSVVSGGGEGFLLVRDAGGRLRRPPIAMPDEAGVLCLAPSPDGDRVVVGTMCGAVLVDIAAGTVHPVTGPSGWVRSVCWGRSGWLAVGDDGNLWLSQLGADPEVVRDLGRQLHLVALPALESPHALTRDALRRFALVPLTGGPPRWERADFGPDEVSIAALQGRRLAIAGDVGPIRLLDVRSGSTVTETPAPSPITAMTWSGERLVTAGRDLNLCCFVPSDDWRRERTWPSGHRSWINAIVVPAADASPEADVITAGDDGTVRQGERALGPSVKSPAISVAVASDGRRLATTTGDAVQVWCLETGELTAERAIPKAIAIALHQGALIAAELGGLLSIYPLEGGRGESPSQRRRIPHWVSRLVSVGDTVIAVTDSGPIELDARTLEPRGPAHPGLLSESGVARPRGPWLEWRRAQTRWRAAILPGPSIVLQRGDEALVSPGARPYVRIWDGCTLTGLLPTRDPGRFHQS
jgi:hypothetical protein